LSLADYQHPQTQPGKKNPGEESTSHSLPKSEVVGSGLSSFFSPTEIFFSLSELPSFISIMHCKPQSYNVQHSPYVDNSG
jgi:hypothetical protein